MWWIGVAMHKVQLRTGASVGRERSIEALSICTVPIYFKLN